ncbi:MAG: SDR family oxidoreductase [Pseudomonadales bacterium]|nr:SDR family oxidoreductase [Pseudomonadales bacterium]
MTTKTVLITGASSGIGHATAERSNSRGASRSTCSTRRCSQRYVLKTSNGP